MGRQGWLGSKDAILHSGEGPVQEIKWAGTLIAWANDLGVKVHDTTVHQRIAYIERPRSRHETLQGGFKSLSAFHLTCQQQSLTGSAVCMRLRAVGVPFAAAQHP